MGIFLAALMLSMISLQANQAVGASIDPTKPVTWSGVFENMVVKYLVEEFETPSGKNEGEVALGYDPFSYGSYNRWLRPFWGDNITIAEGDTIVMKVDTRNDSWEVDSGDSSIIVEPFAHYYLSFAPIAGHRNLGGTNCSLIHNGKAQWVTQILLRTALLPETQKIYFGPYDPADPTKWDNYYIPILGDATDNGTIAPGNWHEILGETPSRVSVDYHTVDFDPDSTFFMRYENIENENFTSLGEALMKVYNKIPATFDGNLATWNFSYTMFNWDVWGAKMVSRCYDYGHGWENPRPFWKVVTDNNTGIAQSIEFDMSLDSAWKFKDDRGHTFWGLRGVEHISHPLTTQIAKLKLTLIPTVAPAFEAVFVFVGISIVALAVFISRRRNKEA